MATNDFIVKTDCPKCGGKKKIRTKVSFAKSDAYFAKAKCYKCGYCKPATWAIGGAIKTTWTPPVDDTQAVLAA